MSPNSAPEFGDGRLTEPASCDISFLFMKSFIRYFGGTIVRPFSTFESLQSDPKGFAKGTRAIFIPAVLFTITAGLLAFGGALPPASAVLPLGGENYYFYQIFFALPVLLASWAVASVIARLFGRWGKGTGSLRGTLAALGFAFGLPALAAWVGQAVFAGLILSGMSQEEFMELTASCRRTPSCAKTRHWPRSLVSPPGRTSLP
jgi:hypothetical protein